MPLDGDSPFTLALDAAGSSCSVVVAEGDRVLGAEHRAIAHGQAEALLPMVDRAMRQSGVAIAALDLVAVTTGPGSFTGIRVGLAASQGIALGLDLPLLGVTSFEAAAAIGFAIPADCCLMVALESRRADLYVQIFDAAGCPLGRPAAVLPEALSSIAEAVIGVGRKLAVAGDAAARAVAALGARPGMILVDDREHRVLGALRAALRRWHRGERGQVPVRPFYLRPPDASPAAARLEPSGL